MDAAPQFRSVDACIGLHASASTWVFNIVRELRLAADAESALSAYADTLKELPAGADKRLTLKSHHGEDALEDWLLAQGATLILSLRDPRDAALSMSQRFGAPLQATAQWLAADCRRLLRLAPRARLLLRYEQRFFAQPQTVGELALAIGAPATDANASRIFESYATAKVKAFASSIATLPPERTQAVNNWMMDKITQIHGPHIGNGAVGKWRRLPASSRDRLTRLYADFLNAFGYGLD